MYTVSPESTTALESKAFGSRVGFDNSGWTVSTSGSSASASRSQSTEGSDLAKYIVLGIAAIAVIGWTKKK